MSSLWFIVPAHGRLQLAAICLRQLRRTCDALTAEGIEATAVVIADDGNLDMARELGFGTVERDNRFVSRKFNDGIQLACDPRYSPRPADYVVPCGSDDWVDWRLLLDLPPRSTVRCFEQLSFVREDGLEISPSQTRYAGGCGIRIYPRELMAAMDYRPADEDRRRACDTSILTNLRGVHGDALRVHHAESDWRQIVDWKSHDEQLNTYDAVKMWRRDILDEPFQTLADVFPAEALEEMERYYASIRERELQPA